MLVYLEPTDILINKGKSPRLIVDFEKPQQVLFEVQFKFWKLLALIRMSDVDLLQFSVSSSAIDLYSFINFINLKFMVPDQRKQEALSG